MLRYNYLLGDIVNIQKKYKIDYIVHQVNCQGKMGSGVAKRIKDEYPIVYKNYMAKCLSAEKPENVYSTIQIVPLYEEYNEGEWNPQCCNFFSQFDYGYDGKRYTSYDAFWICLNRLKQCVPKGSSIAFPANIGCGLGGANWNIILQMIIEVLGKDYEIYIVDYNGGNENAETL